MEIRAVLLDLGETLFHENTEYEKKRFVEIAVKYTGSEKAWVNRFYRAYGLRRGFCETGLEAVAYYYAARAGRGRVDLGLARRIEDEILDVIVEALKPVPSVRSVLEKLSSTGYRLGIISNASSQRGVERLLEENGLLEFFDVIVTSRLLGVRKPDPRIFYYALHMLGVKPGNAVYVGDRGYEDVYGAKNAGLKAIHLAVDEEPSPLADAVVQRIDEVPAAIARIAAHH